MWCDCVVHGDVWVFVLVWWNPVVESVCRCPCSGDRRGGKYGEVEVRNAGGFAVPACTLRVDSAVGELSIHLTGPFEAV